MKERNIVITSSVDEKANIERISMNYSGFNKFELLGIFEYYIQLLKNDLTSDRNIGNTKYEA